MTKVKCIYCKQDMEKSSPECIKVSERRYAHLDCHTQNYSEEFEKKKIFEKEKEEIRKKAKEYLKNTYNAQKVGKQIKQFLEQGMTTKEIYNAVCYWFEVKKNTEDKAYGGIGIVPYIKDEAKRYYEKLEQISNSNSFVENYEKPVEKIYFILPERIKKPKRSTFFKIE